MPATRATSHDFGRDLIPRAAQGRRGAHRFDDSCVNMVGDRPYWRDVGTLDAYWEANLDLTGWCPSSTCTTTNGPSSACSASCRRRSSCSTTTGGAAWRVDSLVSDGCIVSGGTVRRSILFKVRVGDGSLVEDSVVLPNVRIGCHVVLKRAIVDKRCVLPDGFQAGVDPLTQTARASMSPRAAWSW
jgi:glucose-1-phosphate adenylyltransferase